jgi:hypothetical protein
VIPADPLFNNTVGCFPDAFFVKSTGSGGDDEGAAQEDAIAAQLLWVMSGGPRVFAAVRALYTNKTFQRDRVVIDYHVAPLSQQFVLMFPDADIGILPKTDDLAVIADCMAEASVYISGHITTMLFCVFLSPMASVVEVQPQGLECTAFGKKLAAVLSLKYVPFRTRNCTKCNDTDLGCYLRERAIYAPMPDSDLKDTLVRLHALVRP